MSLLAILNEGRAKDYVAGVCISQRNTIFSPFQIFIEAECEMFLKFVRVIIAAKQKQSKGNKLGQYICIVHQQGSPELYCSYAGKGCVPHMLHVIALYNSFNLVAENFRFLIFTEYIIFCLLTPWKR